MTDKNVSAKRANGKWFNFGKLKTNQYGNLQLSFKNTPEFKAFVNGSGEWINFSLFEDKPKEVDVDTEARLKELKESATITDEIPF